MSRARGIALAWLATLGAFAASSGRAATLGAFTASSGRAATPAGLAAGAEGAGTSASSDGPVGSGLEPLVPELAAHPFRLEPGVREFRNRMSVSPAWGNFGSDRLFALRVAYNPCPWLGYEGAIAHIPGRSVHAALHSFNAVVRRPLPGRLQPYLTGGYGMMLVFPGQSVNAAPVTKNTLSGGGGLELYVRSDLALRADLRLATVFGRQGRREGIVAYDYPQGSIGLAFYRSVRP